MGDALPNGNDLDVINQLNNAFTGASFGGIRQFVADTGDDFLWGNNRNLARASWRLGIWPTATTTPSPKRRWFAFLGRILSKTNRDDIKRGLKNAVLNNTGNVIGMQFWAQYDPNVAPNSYIVVVSDVPAGAGQIYRKITILTDHEIPSSEAGDPNPGPDNGEKPPVHPLGKKKKTKKGRKKKTAKKKAKKYKSS
ncbi:hypothetical protein JQ615_01185 [Bradyrhizobium jicamae]|uniref:Uncharacterized protein n=1 Tax=Bradyrhizobium jicamae TaxID=280332 RepID=A0ABS5FB34_9BRAD|nr:hypothetical protein [Bradyrhizobium jicamae]MBR0793995.1 hypothetical protein [Bradyrhizobium jicamae]